MPYTHNKQLVSLAKQLRENMTDEERKLWFTFLRSYPLRFSRQKIIGRYIVDFYCASAKLVIELDGSQHYEISNKLQDKKRSDYLQSIGIKVIRIPNSDIHSHFHEVCQYIDMVVQKSIAPNL